MQDGEVELGQRVALLGGAAEPGRRRLGIGLGALVTRCRGDVATRLTRVGGGAVAAAGAVLLVL